MSPLSELR